MKVKLAAQTLKHEPSKLQIEKRRQAEELQQLMGEAAWEMLKSLNSWVGQVKHVREVGQWLREIIDAHFNDGYPVLAWATQNTVEQSKQSTVLISFYQNILDNLRLSLSIGQILMGIRAQIMPVVSSTLPENLRLFRAGHRAEALLSL